MIRNRLLIPLTVILSMLGLAGCGRTSHIVAPASNGRNGVTRTVNPSRVVSTHKSANPSPAVGIMHLSMMSSRIGWAVGNSHQIMITTNGGKTWTNVTPSRLPTHASGFFVNLAALSSSSADVVWSQGDKGSVYFAATKDYGRQWTIFHTAIVSYGIVQLDPLSSQDLWMLVPSVPGGPVSQATIYQSTTGGHSWNKVAHGPYLTMKFLSARIGWAGGFFPISGQSPLWVTTTGGHSWHQIALPFPPQLDSQQMQIAHLEIFSHHVVTVAEFPTDHGIKLLLYRQKLGPSHSWKIASPLRNTQPISLTLISSQQGWALTKTPPGAWKLMQTVNGGTTWHLLGTLPIPFNINNLHLQFVTAHDGWIWGEKNTKNHTDYFLWRTTDGGSHWQPINPSITLVHRTH